MSDTSLLVPPVAPTDAVVATPTSGRINPNLAFLIAFGIFATTLAQPQVLGGLPFFYILNDELKANEELVAFFFAASAVTW